MIPVVYIGFFEMGITFILWMLALNKSKSTVKLSNLVYLSPFISFIFISIVLKEHIYYSTIIGLILIVSGILFQQFYKSKSQIVSS